MSVKVLLTINQEQGSLIFELKVLPYRGYLIFVDRFVTRIVIFYVQFLTFPMLYCNFLVCKRNNHCLTP